MIRNRVVSMLIALSVSASALLSAACASAPQKPADTSTPAPKPESAASAPKADTPAPEKAEPAPATQEQTPAEKPVEKNPAIEALLKQAEGDRGQGQGLNPMAGDPMAASWADYQPQPPDGVWLVDLEGREYFVQPIPKQEGQYMRTGPNMVRVPPGIPLILEREDDAYFYVKVFKKGEGSGPKGRSGGPKPSAGDLEAIAKTYEVSTPASDEISFTAIGAGLPTRGQWRNGFALADVDGDGAIDLIHGPARRTINGMPVIFRGDGKGGFTRWQEVKWPDYPYDYGDAAAGDFNNDGKIDLAFGIHLRGIVAMLGDGKGNFTPFSDGLELFNPEVKTWSVSPFTSRALEVVDWNRDGFDDVIGLSEGPARAGLTGPEAYTPGKRIFLGGPKGWKHAEGTLAADPTIGDTIALGDFNADKRTDFVTGVSMAGGKSVINIANPKGTGWNVSTIESLRPAAVVQGVAAADLNGDRRDDIVLSWVNTEAGVSRVGIDAFLTQPGGWVRVGLWGRTGRKGVRSLAMGDLDGDGHSDLVGFTDDSQPLIFKGQKGGKFTLESADGIDMVVDECAGYAVALVDLDKDGRDEIVAGFAGEQCSTQGSLRAWKAGPARK